jgi:biopolymer transport protein ExbB
MWGQSIPDLFQRGGTVMWPLLAVSVLALAIAIERALVLAWNRARFARFRAALEPLVLAGRYRDAMELARRSESPLAKVAAAYLTRLEMTKDLRDQAVAREASQQLVRLGKRVNSLSALGTIAPMLGLLGTVTGLVAAFWQIEIKAGQVQPADLASGIWEALLTTVFGLVIAIPTLAVYHLLDQRLGMIELQMQWLVAYLDEWVGRTTDSKAEPNNASDSTRRHRSERALTAVGVS